MAKIILTDIANLQNENSVTTNINNNNHTLETAMENTLSRDGTAPNQMEASLDMNSNHVLNLPKPVQADEPLRLQDLNDFVGGGIVTNIPLGGNTGDVLTKNSGTNFDVAWHADTFVLAAGTNMAVTGTSPATISTIPNPIFTTVNSLTLTTSTGVFTLANAKTLTVSNTLTFVGTDATTMTFPSASGAVLTAASTNTLTNKTYDTAGAGNSLSINGLAATANTGTGAVVRATSPALTTPTLGVATVTTINKVTITPPATASTLTVLDGTTLTGPAASDTLVGRGSTDTLTNKTFDTAGTGNAFKVNGNPLTANAGTSTITLPAGNTFTGSGTSAVWFDNIPQNSQSVAYTLVASDAYKHVLHPTADNNARTFTIPANSSVAYPLGTTITFINLINVVTIAITTDTLILAGLGTTGSRTLAANGMATAIKITSTSWMISGAGLT